MGKNTRIFIAGHEGMIGSAILHHLRSAGYKNLLTRPHEALDLVDQESVRRFFQNERIDYVVLAAAKVGGIHANIKYPAEFIYQNLMIEANVIHEAYRAGIRKLLFFGSSCIYPKNAQQPIKEKSLLTGPLENTSIPYAIAKISGIKLCESYNRQYDMQYRTVLPNNVYGPGDNFDLETSHVMAAMIRKFHEATLSKSPVVELWGTGKPRREFLFVDDLASACKFIMELDDEIYKANTHPMQSHINLGAGKDITINELSEIVRKVVGYKGKVIYNRNMPDGAPRKLLDVSLIHSLGWQANTSLTQGIEITYRWYWDNKDKN